MLPASELAAREVSPSYFQLFNLFKLLICRLARCRSSRGIGSQLRTSDCRLRGRAPCQAQRPDEASSHQHFDCGVRKVHYHSKRMIDGFVLELMLTKKSFIKTTCVTAPEVTEGK